MTHPAHAPTTEQTRQADEMRVYGFYTLRGDSRLWMARLDGPERVTVRPLRHWKLAAGTALVVLWSLAAALSKLAA